MGEQGGVGGVVLWGWAGRGRGSGSPRLALGVPVLGGVEAGTVEVEEGRVLFPGEVVHGLGEAGRQSQEAGVPVYSVFPPQDRAGGQPDIYPKASSTSANNRMSSER